MTLTAAKIWRPSLKPSPVKRLPRTKVEHDLTITGPELELERFLETCFTVEDGERQLNFDKLIPQPEHLTEQLVPWVSGGTTFQIPDWYAWSLEHWGTKWNAAHTKVTRLESGAISLSFDTAWAPARPIYEELADRFPALTIEGGFEELMMGFGAEIRCHAGEIRYVDKSAEIKAWLDEIYAKHVKEAAERREADAHAETREALARLDDDEIPFSRKGTEQ